MSSSASWWDTMCSATHIAANVAAYAAHATVGQFMGKEIRPICKQCTFPQALKMRFVTTILQELNQHVQTRISDDERRILTIAYSISSSLVAASDASGVKIDPIKIFEAIETVGESLKVSPSLEKKAQINKLKDMLRDFQLDKYADPLFKFIVEAWGVADASHKFEERFRLVPDADPEKKKALESLELDIYNLCCRLHIHLDEETQSEAISAIDNFYGTLKPILAKKAPDALAQLEQAMSFYLFMKTIVSEEAKNLPFPDVKAALEQHGFSALANLLPGSFEEAKQLSIQALMEKVGSDDDLMKEGEKLFKELNSQKEKHPLAQNLKPVMEKVATKLQEMEQKAKTEAERVKAEAKIQAKQLEEDKIETNTVLLESEEEGDESDNYESAEEYC